MSFQKRIDHVGIAVRDLETTLRFYTEIVGLELKDRVTHTNGVIQLAFLGFNGSNETEIELIQGYSGQACLLKVRCTILRSTWMILILSTNAFNPPKPNLSTERLSHCLTVTAISSSMDLKRNGLNSSSAKKWS